jgi:hypothetical protein
MAFGRLANHLLRPRGQYVASITEPGPIRDFLRMVRPVTAASPLVRIGAAGDGGYLVPDDLDGIAACFSPGVSDIAAFESDLAARGIPSYMADFSVDAPPSANPLFHFEKKYLGLVDDATYVTLDSWVARHAPGDADLLLQMDIEGGEYDVLLDVSNDTLRRFRIVVIEFHWLDAMAISPLAFAWLRATFAKLLKNFAVVHIHPNNCEAPREVSGFAIPPVMEFTFVRRDRPGTSAPAREFPHPLDAANVPGRPDFALPACWHDAYLTP